MRSKIFLASVALLGLVFAFSTRALAEDLPTLNNEPTQTPKGTPLFRLNDAETPDPSEKPEPSEGPRIKGIDRLEGKRLQFCENHQEEVNTRLTNLGRLVANILGKFDAIAARVEKFYTDKIVPSGKTVPNYDALVSDIAAKKTAVNTAFTSAQADINGFTCNADNPKGQIKLFRTDMQTVKKALKDYRTSIQNLIVAVKSVVGETESKSPEPSETPEATP